MANTNNLLFGSAMTPAWMIFFNMLAASHYVRMSSEWRLFARQYMCRCVRQLDSSRTLITFRCSHDLVVRSDVCLPGRWLSSHLPRIDLILWCSLCHQRRVSNVRAAHCVWNAMVFDYSLIACAGLNSYGLYYDNNIYAQCNSFQFQCIQTLKISQPEKLQ